MPELPEVETIRRDLNLLRGARVIEVEVRKRKMVRGQPGQFKRDLKGLTVQRVARRGKLLVFLMSQEKALLVHMKMTGQLIYRDRKILRGGGHGVPKVTREELPNKYTHIVITFGNGAKLFFNDMRQFGYMQLVGREELAKILSRYGVEPLGADFTKKKLQQLLRGRETTVKNVLLDQRGVAGLGNIYVDELCHAAKVRPMRRAAKVTAVEAGRLRQAAVAVLKKSIAARGTTFSDYRDGLGGEGGFVKRLKVYGRAGKPCLRCKTILKRVKVGGRGTVYCPKCQK